MVLLSGGCIDYNHNSQLSVWLRFVACKKLILNICKNQNNVLGMLIGGDLRFSGAARDFFKNCTLTAAPNTTHICNDEMLSRWRGSERQFSVFLTLSCWLVVYVRAGGTRRSETPAASNKCFFFAVFCHDSRLDNSDALRFASARARQAATNDIDVARL